MHNILVHSETSGQGSSISQLLEANLPHQIMTSDKLLETLELLSQKIYHLIIFECQVFTEDDYRFVRDMRTDGFPFPILILADHMNFTNFSSARTNDRLHWLRKPYKDKELVGVVRKLLHAKLIPQQMYRRYATNQNVVVETLLDGQVIPTSMYNLSKGGAYFEFDNKDPLSIGDLVRLNVNLPDMESKHQLNARVVWLTRRGRYSGRCGAGFKFVREDDIYRFLAERV